jgi:hypothetical protein
MQHSHTLACLPHRHLPRVAQSTHAFAFHTRSDLQPAPRPTWMDDDWSVRPRLTAISQAPPPGTRRGSMQMLRATPMASTRLRSTCRGGGRGAHGSCHGALMSGGSCIWGRCAWTYCPALALDLDESTARNLLFCTTSPGQHLRLSLGLRQSLPHKLNFPPRT